MAQIVETDSFQVRLLEKWSERTTSQVTLDRIADLISKHQVVVDPGTSFSQPFLRLPCSMQSEDLHDLPAQSDLTALPGVFGSDTT